MKFARWKGKQEKETRASRAYAEILKQNNERKKMK